LTTFKLDDVFSAITIKLDTTTSIDTLVNIAEYAIEKNPARAADLYLKTLDLGLMHDNEQDKVVIIITKLTDLNKNFRTTNNVKIITSLHSGFLHTNNDSILNSIIKIVKQYNWQGKLKNLLKNNVKKLDIFKEHEKKIKISKSFWNR